MLRCRQTVHSEAYCVISNLDNNESLCLWNAPHRKLTSPAFLGQQHGSCSRVNGMDDSRCQWCRHPPAQSPPFRPGPLLARKSSYRSLPRTEVPVCVCERTSHQCFFNLIRKSTHIQNYSLISLRIDRERWNGMSNELSHTSNQYPSSFLVHLHTLITDVNEELIILGLLYPRVCPYLVVPTERRYFHPGLGQRRGLRVLVGDTVYLRWIDLPYLVHCREK